MPTMEIKRLDAWRRRGLRVGLIALGAAVVVAPFAPASFFRGYLCAFMFVVGLPLGAGAWLMVHHLTGGRWGTPIRPALEAAAATLPWLAIPFLGVLVGIPWLYEWADAPRVAESEALRAKAGYLNAPFFVARGALYFILWEIVGRLLVRSGAATGDSKGSVRRRPGLAAAGLIIYVITMSFAAIDWVGSLEAEWYSSILGLYVIIGQALLALAALLVTATRFGRDDGEPFAPPDVLHDLGNLLLACVALHAYFAYSQFFIIWNGNLPHEIVWYAPRMRGFWGAVTGMIMLAHFALPLALLLSRQVKRAGRALAGVAGVLLAARGLDTLWFVVPASEGVVWPAALIAPSAAVGLTGLWASLFLRQWSRGPLFLEAHQGRGEPALQDGRKEGRG